MKNNIYPMTIIKDRYSGMYSHGKYTAWNVEFDEMPKEIIGGDEVCENFWWENDVYEKYIVGLGDTPKDAEKDLLNKLHASNHK